MVAAQDLPPGFAAVLSGHIHRHQVLEQDLTGRPLTAPVLYPGSTERTSIAEKNEIKGVLTLKACPGHQGGRLDGWAFHPLPTRPMHVRDVDARELGPVGLEQTNRRILDGVPDDAVLRIRVLNHPRDAHAPPLSAARLRALAPSTMNVDLRVLPPP